MSYMFERCNKFNQDISNWDVSNVTNMDCMFRLWGSFNQDISSWDVSKLIKKDRMFYGCKIKEKYKPNYFV